MQQVLRGVCGLRFRSSRGSKPAGVSRFQRLARTEPHSFRCLTTRSTFSTYVSPIINITDYFLSDPDQRVAPKIPDFTGPVRIGRTEDGRGRGLFVAQDVMAGDVLVVNNAFCATYNDNEKDGMCRKIAAMLKESPRVLRQFCSLAGFNHQNELEVPDVNLFDNNIPYAGPMEMFEINEDHIRDIVRVNSFSGKQAISNRSEFSLMNRNEKFNGLWLLPSFINHSCSPSASRNMVGEVMLFMAGRNMKAGEEVTICYTDCLVPLKTRENILQRTGYGFLCQCERCVLERSMHGQIWQLSERYHASYDKAASEVYVVATTRGKGSFTASKELGVVYESLRTKVCSLKSLSNVQKQWVLGGYSSAFLANFLTSGYTTDFTPEDGFVTPTAIELVKAMAATVPGMQRTLSFAMKLATLASSRRDCITLAELAMDECLRLYGKQMPDDSRNLASQAIQLVPFF